MKHKVDEQRFFEVLKNSGYKCGYCGTDLDDKTITPDFKIPRSLGGEDTLDNLLAVCKNCAKLKGHLTVEEFRAAIFESISQLLDKAYDAYEKVTILLDDDTDDDVRRALISAKGMMKHKISIKAVTFFFEESKAKVASLVPNEAERINYGKAKT